MDLERAGLRIAAGPSISEQGVCHPGNVYHLPDVVDPNDVCPRLMAMSNCCGERRPFNRSLSCRAASYRQRGNLGGSLSRVRLYVIGVVFASKSVTVKAMVLP